tara:strand:- start:24834 stop:25493 length:660 start_codon:yes stop_codon:yes gene_type:complete
MGKVYEAILFDMDGVLLDSEPLFLKAINDSLIEYGVDVITDEENRSFLIGTTIHQTWERIKSVRSLDKSVEELISDYEQHVLQIFGGPLDARPGVKDLVAYCKSQHIPIAVASSSQHRWIDIKLKAIGLYDVFDSVMGGDDVTNGKPDPEVYLRSAEKLGISPIDCIAVEDSPVGIASAVSSGAYTIAVKTDSTLGLDVSAAAVLLDDLTYFDYQLLKQ